MPASGDSRFRRFPLIPSRNRALPTGCPPCAGPLSRREMVHPRSHPGAAGDTAPRSAAAASNVRAGSVSELASPSCAGPTISPLAHQAHLSRLFDAHPRLRTAMGRSPRALPALRSRRPRSSQPGPGAVRRSLRHRPDPRIPRHRRHHHRMGRRNTRLPHQQTSIQRTHRRHQQPPPESYAESPTDSPTMAITQPEESL